MRNAEFGIIVSGFARCYFNNKKQDADNFVLFFIIIVREADTKIPHSEFRITLSE